MFEFNNEGLVAVVSHSSVRMLPKRTYVLFSLLVSIRNSKVPCGRKLCIFLSSSGVRGLPTPSATMPPSVHVVRRPSGRQPCYPGGENEKDHICGFCTIKMRSTSAS